MASGSRERDFEVIKSGFERMIKEEIVIAPWLAMNSPERLKPDIKASLEKAAGEFAIRDNQSQLLWLNSNRMNLEFRRQAYYETLASTAAYLSHMRLGTLVITAEMTSVATSLMRRYLAENDGSAIVSVYFRVMLYLNGQVLKYFGRVPEEIFLSGKWHRPWIDYSLSDELEAGIHQGMFTTVKENGQNFVQLTALGEEFYQECREDLKKCGYLKQRERLMRASSFTNMEDYEVLMDRSFQDIRGFREKLLRWSGIRPGMKVLELGCGSGALTLNGGLYRMVGKTGRVVATDPSVGMLERAKKKLSELDGDYPVQFQQAAAEEIPFPDNEFDAVIGMMFLHFTDIPKAFQEIHRVTRSGGKFTTIYALSVPMQRDFFIEWFQPVIDKGLVETSSASLPERGFVSEIAGKYFWDFECRGQDTVFDLSQVEDVVKFIVEAGTFADLNDLPWQARETLFQGLIERGYKIKQKYGDEGMTRIAPAEWFQGTIDK